MTPCLGVITAPTSFHSRYACRHQGDIILEIPFPLYSYADVRHPPRSYEKSQYVTISRLIVALDIAESDIVVKNYAVEKLYKSKKCNIVGYSKSAHVCITIVDRYYIAPLSYIVYI